MKNKGEKKKKNIFVYFVEMVIIFIALDFIIDGISTMLGISILSFKYGKDLIFKSLSILIMIIILLISKNSYIFKDKHTGFFKSIFLGLPLLLISIIVLIDNIVKVGDIKYFGNIINLILFSLSVGVFEEFLCRGWLQNEFIERYGNNRKNVLISIALSSLVFGMIHFVNFLGGQPLLPTLFQILFATIFGMVLGGIYYRTKNIWSVAFIHGLWDFSIFYGEVFRLRDCIPLESYYTSFIAIISQVLQIIIFISMAIILLRKEKLNELVDEEVTEDIINKDKTIKRVAFSFLVISLLLAIIPVDKYIETEKCYNYPEEEIDEYDVIFPERNNYNLVFDNNSYVLSGKDKKIVIKDKNKKEVVSYDYLYEYIVIENSDNYVIAYEKVFNNYGSTISVATIEKDKFIDDMDLKNLKFKDIEIPEITSLGEIRPYGSDQKYLYFKCDNLPGLFFKDGKVKMVKLNK